MEAGLVVIAIIQVRGGGSLTSHQCQSYGQRNMENPVKLWSGGLTNGVYVVGEGKLKSPFIGVKVTRKMYEARSNQIFSEVFRNFPFKFKQNNFTQVLSVSDLNET